MLCDAHRISSKSHTSKDKIKIHLLCGNFTVGLYMCIHTKINNSIQNHIKGQKKATVSWRTPNRVNIK